MAEFLTQEEIDTLLDIAEEAELSIPKKKSEVINFLSLNKKEIKEINNIINISLSEKSIKPHFLTQEEIDTLLDIAEEAENLINKEL